MTNEPASWLRNLRAEGADVFSGDEEEAVDIDLGNLLPTDRIIELMHDAPPISGLDWNSPVVSNSVLRKCYAAELFHLNLCYSGAADDSLDGIRDAENLETLLLASTAVTNAAIRQIASMKIETLHIDETRCDDGCVDALLTLSRLRVLDISSTGISGDGLVRLAALSGLEELTIHNTACSFEAMDRFMEKFSGPENPIHY